MNVLDKILSGIVGGLCAFIVIYIVMNKPANVCSVNVNLIVDDFIKTMAQSKIPSERLENDTNQYMKQLQIEIVKIAKERQVTLLLSEAVVGGAPDITDVIKSRTDKNYQKVINTGVAHSDKQVKHETP